MHYIIIYSIIFLVIIFIVVDINKRFYLEGYTFVPNLYTSATPIYKLDNWDVREDTCKINCDAHSLKNPSEGCSGFISNIPPNSGKRGACRFYDKNKLNLNKMDNLQYNTNSHFYIR